MLTYNEFIGLSSQEKKAIKFRKKGLENGIKIFL